MISREIVRSIGLDRAVSINSERKELSESQSIILDQVQGFNIDSVYFNTDNTGNSFPAIFLKKVISFESETLRDVADIQRKIWNYKKVFFLYVYSDLELRIYNCSEKPLVITRENFDEDKELQKIEITRYLFSDKERLKELNMLFSTVAVDSGVIWNLEEAEFVRKKINLQKRVDKYLVESLINSSKQLEELGLEINLIHRLILRSLFLLYLEDREATDENFYSNIKAGAKSFFDILEDTTSTYTLFQRLEDHFNGNVFTISENENITVEHLQLIKKCFISGNDNTPQANLFEDWRIFDFSIIQIELLSEIYENFLFKTDPELKKETGTYYTPPALVEFILNEQLPVNNGETDYNLKILDPTCGSGIFLVESFKRLVKRYENSHKQKLTDFNELKKLLTEHIFGIELHPQAIKVAAFSLYLALVDNLNPKTIWQSKNYRLPYLINNPEDPTLGQQGNNLSLLIRPEWKSRLDKMVVLQPVTFRDKTEYNLHRILRAIDLNTLGSKLAPEDYCAGNEVMGSLEALIGKYSQYSLILENTYALINTCHFEYEFKVPRNKKHYTSGRDTDLELLTSLAHQGLAKRYGTNNVEARERVEKELQVIHQLEFSGYFLITWDIIRYSNSMGFLHIGRGSGANSIIAYCLGITDICPLELDLYFERFLNLNRKSPPDFDIDWSWKERDVILDYIFKRYGTDHVAFCGTNVEFKYKSIFREVGKVFGLPKEDLDALSGKPMDQHDKNDIVKMVHRYGMMMEKYPNQRSMHSCGILISEDPITNFTALEMPPKGFPIVQFDMHVAEEIGFDKFDILSQRGIGHIDESVKLIKKNRGVDINIRDTSLSKDEAACNAFLGQGKTIGCFYIESPAMRGLLRRLKCNNYKVLVAASSIIRPGVAQSGMMKEYIFRHNYPDKFEYFHPVFQEQLGETYGIMVYQEDVIKIALHYGGLAAADGDILRRAMSGKGRSKAALQKVKDNFFASCAAKGHPEQLSTEIYRQIESFAGYSFCKAHSASYAVESYQSLYLKVHYPIEFMVAVINNQGGFYRTEVYVHEARMSGAEIHNPCVNKSGVETTLYGKDIYLGFMHLQGLQAEIAQKIVDERNSNGEYISLEDFINRVPIGIEGLQLLIYIGALRSTGKAKNELLVTARRIMMNFKPENRLPQLLPEPVREYRLPELKRSSFEDAFDEIELLGFPVSVTPFNLLKTSYRGDVMARDLVSHHKKQVKMLAYLVSRKHVPTKMGAMYFGTWIDANGEFFDTAHFTGSLRDYPFKGGGCYLLLGTVEVDYHFPTITISKMEKMPFIPDPRYRESDAESYRTQEKLREDVSMTQRAPYPQEQEIGLPRHKMKAN